jgi:hypothetical protein
MAKSGIEQPNNQQKTNNKLEASKDYPNKQQPLSVILFITIG